jgi:hypothetical protein
MLSLENRVNRTTTPSLSSMSLYSPRVHLPCNNTITPPLNIVKMFDEFVGYLLSLGIGFVIGEVV